MTDGPSTRLIARLSFLALLLMGLTAAAQAAEPSPAQKEALLELIRSLEKLKVQPESSPVIASWIAEETQRTEAELKSLDEQVQQLQQKRQALADRVAALRVGGQLFGQAATQPAAVVAAAPAAPASQPVALSSDPQLAFFQEHVRPILENTCFDCHGGKFKKGSLDLSTRETLLKGGDTGPAIVAGNAEASLLYKLITHSQDPHMPAKGPKLADPAIAGIAKWLNEGAQYDRPLSAPQNKQAAVTEPEKPKHWAFIAPQRPAIPAVKNAAWVRNPIDAFVLAKLEAEDIAPSPESDRRTLIRRLSLDLTGLPPKPNEVDEFVNDQQPDAYERLVDRMLASPHYGERWGRHWLDLSHYADSDGYEKDSERPFAWRWRDWVIDAINRDLPFDRFTVEQLAGDLLPDANVEHKVATGFLRNTLTNKEGGVDQEEYRTKAVVDRVSTAGTVWLGLTVACAECHTHKFDPITQREFYELYAFFNTADEIDVPAPLPKEAENFAKAKQAFDEKQNQLKAVLAAFDKEQLPARQAAWETKSHSQEVNWTILEPLLVTSEKGTTLTPQPDGSILAGGKPPGDSYIVTAQTELTGITALRLEALTDPSLPNKGPGRANGNFVLLEFEVQVVSPDNPAHNEKVLFQKASADFFQTDRPWPIEHTIDGNTDTGWAIDPQMGRDHVAVFETKQDINHSGPIILTFRLDQFYGADHTLGKFRLSATTAKRPIAIELMPQDILATLKIEPAQRTAEQSTKLMEYYRGIDAERIPLQKAVEEHAKTEPKTPNAQTVTQATTPRKTHIHTRGDFLRKGAEVQPATLAVLHPFKPRGAAPDRVDLAKWLIDPANPLTPRVTVNRVWQYLFGRGLVATPEDFGTRSDPPSHPELLDWLATEMIARGWSQKAMIKLIVESAAYRQSSRMRPELLERDPKNILLARQSRFRLEAEVVRDLILTSSGLLNETIGGPGIRPPLPADVAALGYAGSVTWPESPAPDKYRRGMYIFFQRTVPYPMLVTFDAPDSNVACTRRERSNTPLQSLTLLNAPDFFECAQTLGMNAMKNTKTPDERIRYIFRSALGREPDDQEISRLEQLWKEIDGMFRGDETAAAKMVGEPQVKLVSGQLTDAAGWVAVARTVLNLDEFVTRE